MKAIFYDRKHNCEVSNEELMLINLVVDLVNCTNDDFNGIDSYHEYQLGELGYKSENCPDYRNWDIAVMYTDLVFLRFEGEENLDKEL